MNRSYKNIITTALLIFALAQGISAKELDSEAMDYRRSSPRLPDNYRQNSSYCCRV